MIWVYVAATIFGGAFLIPMLLGGLSSDLDGGFDGNVADTDLSGGLDTNLDLDADIDLDVDVDLNLDADIGYGLAAGGGYLDGGFADNDLLGSIFSSLLSFRTIVFFCAFFGAAGLVFGAIGYGTSITAASAVLVGAIAAVANSLIFGLIKNTQSTSQISDRTLEGRPAMVVLPMNRSQRGRIRIELSGQPQYIVARPLQGIELDEPEQKFDVGASVVVVKIEEGTAHVASLPELDLKEES